MKALKITAALTLLIVALSGLLFALAESARWPVGLGAAGLLCLALVALVLSATHQREKIHDIERALTRSRLRAEAVIEASPDGIVLMRDERLEHVNPAFRELLAIPPDEETAGRDFLSLVAEQDRTRVEAWIRARERGRVEPCQLAFTGLRRSGAPIELEARCALVPTRQGKQLALFLRDLTRRRALEVRLHHVARLEALADAAESLAQFFEKIFRDIRRLGREGQSSEDPVRALARIERLATRGSALARRVHQLAPNAVETESLQAVEIPDLVREVAADFLRALPSPLNLELAEPSAGSLVSMVDPGQIRQALWQVLQNAAEAQKEGKILLRLRSLELDEARSGQRPGSHPGAYVMIEVRDTGTGMNERVRARAFSPFFTTKGKRASGLGLTMVYGAIRAHGGFVEIDSEPGRGTIVRLALPRVDRPADASMGHPADPRAQWRGRETLLVVDDDPAARDECRRILEPFGYLVEVAADPRQALHRLRHQPEIDLILLDMVLPGWNGPDVLKRVLRHWPGQRVLMISPYPLPDQETAAVEAGAVGLYLKPLKDPDLARSVREALDSPPPATMLTGPV